MYSIHIHVYILALFLYIHSTSVRPLFFPLQPPLDKFTGTAAFLCFPLPGAIQSWHLWHCPCPCDSFKPPLCCGGPGHTWPHSGTSKSPPWAIPAAVFSRGVGMSPQGWTKSSSAALRGLCLQGHCDAAFNPIHVFDNDLSRAQHLLLTLIFSLTLNEGLGLFRWGRYHRIQIIHFKSVEILN